MDEIIVDICKDEEWILYALDALSKSSSPEITSAEEDEATNHQEKMQDFNSNKDEIENNKKVGLFNCEECDESVDSPLICLFCKSVFHQECVRSLNMEASSYCSKRCQNMAGDSGKKRKRNTFLVNEEIMTQTRLKTLDNPASKIISEIDMDDESYSPDESKKAPPKSRRLSSKKPRWTAEEDAKLIELKKKYGDMSWAKISQSMDERTSSQCYQRWHRVLNPAIQKGPWSREEMEVLARAVNEMEVDKISWSQVARHIPGRTDIQCRYQYLKLVRTGKQKTLAKSKTCITINDERRNPQRSRRKPMQDEADASPSSGSEVIDEGEETIFS